MAENSEDALMEKFSSNGHLREEFSKVMGYFMESAPDGFEYPDFDAMTLDEMNVFKQMVLDGTDHLAYLNANLNQDSDTDSVGSVEIVNMNPDQAAKAYQIMKEVYHLDDSDDVFSEEEYLIKNGMYSKEELLTNAQVDYKTLYQRAEDSLMQGLAEDSPLRSMVAAWRADKDYAAEAATLLGVKPAVDVVSTPTRLSSGDEAAVIIEKSLSPMEPAAKSEASVTEVYRPPPENASFLSSDDEETATKPPSSSAVYESSSIEEAPLSSAPTQSLEKPVKTRRRRTDLEKKSVDKNKSGNSARNKQRMPGVSTLVRKKKSIYIESDDSSSQHSGLLGPSDIDDESGTVAAKIQTVEKKKKKRVHFHADSDRSGSEEALLISRFLPQHVAPNATGELGSDLRNLFDKNDSPLTAGKRSTNNSKKDVIKIKALSESKIVSMYHKATPVNITERKVLDNSHTILVKCGEGEAYNYSFTSETDQYRVYVCMSCLTNANISKFAILMKKHNVVRHEPQHGSFCAHVPFED